MKKFFVCAVAVLFAACLFYGCGNDLYIDAQSHEDIIKEMTPIKEHEPLGQNSIMYVDPSTVWTRAKDSSSIYKDMMKQVEYFETLVFIKNDEFEKYYDRENFENRLNEYEQKNYTDIRNAIDSISRGNQQAMIITDFEDIKPGKKASQNSYLTKGFKTWLSRGYQIDIQTEPYYEEKNLLKKRFYVFFTDPENKESKNNTMKEQVKKYIVEEGVPEVGECSWFTLVCNDVCVNRETDKNSCSKDIEVKTIKYPQNHCELNIINNTWEDIKEYVMKLDSHNQVYEGETPLPIVDGLKLSNGINYNVEKLKVQATNISKLYLSKQEKDESLNGDPFDISDAFDIEIDEGNRIKVFVNKNIFSDKHLYSRNDKFDNNMIRLDLIVDGNSYNDFDKDIFNWEEKSGDSIDVVSLSIENQLRDKELVPSGILYTIYLQTESK